MLSNPFLDIDKYLRKKCYKFSIFLEKYVSEHVVFEMPIQDMWDVDTPETVLITEELLKKRGR